MPKCRADFSTAESGDARDPSSLQELQTSSHLGRCWNARIRSSKIHDRICEDRYVIGKPPALHRRVYRWCSGGRFSRLPLEVLTANLRSDVRSIRHLFSLGSHGLRVQAIRVQWFSQLHQAEAILIGPDPEVVILRILHVDAMIAYGLIHSSAKQEIRSDHVSDRELPGWPETFYFHLQLPGFVVLLIVAVHQVHVSPCTQITGERFQAGRFVIIVMAGPRQKRASGGGKSDIQAPR